MFLLLTGILWIDGHIQYFYETTYYFYASVENFEYIYDIIQGILSGDWLKKNVFSNIWPGIIEEYSNEISKVDNAKKKALFSKSIYEEKNAYRGCVIPYIKFSMKILRTTL